MCKLLKTWNNELLHPIILYDILITMFPHRNITPVFIISQDFFAPTYTFTPKLCISHILSTDFTVFIICSPFITKNGYGKCTVPISIALMNLAESAAGSTAHLCKITVEFLLILTLFKSVNLADDVVLNHTSKLEVETHHALCLTSLDGGLD